MYKDLIVYGSKHGTTKETAENMKKNSQNNVSLINLKDEQNIDLNAYDRIFIGTAIYMGQLLGEVNKFLEKYSTVLASKKVVFFVHGCSDEVKSKEILDNKVKSLLTNCNYETFCLGGKLDYKKLNIPTRLFMKMIVKEAPSINEQRRKELYKLCNSM